MKIQILFLTKLSDWPADRNHIIVRYNKQEIVSEQLAFISFSNRYKLAKLLNFDFWQTVKFVTNHYSKKPIYRHYKLLWEDEDITEVIPFLKILYKEPEEYDYAGEKQKRETVMDFIAKFL